MVQKEEQDGESKLLPQEKETVVQVQADPPDEKKEEKKDTEYFIAVLIADKWDYPEAIPEVFEKHPNDDVNEPCQGWLPIQLAAALGHQATVEELLKHPDIDLTKGDKRDGDTPLHSAAYWDHAPVVKLLLKHAQEKGVLRTIINQKNEIADSSPMHIAVSRYSDGSCQEMLNCIPVLGKIFIELDPSRREPGRSSLESDRGIFAGLRKKDKEEMFLKQTEPVIEYHQKNENGASTPINKMIDKAPELVKEILDKSIFEVKIKHVDQSYIDRDRDKFSFNAKKVDYHSVHRVVVDFSPLEYFPEEKIKNASGDVPVASAGGASTPPPEETTPAISSAKSKCERANPEEEIGPTVRLDHYKNGFNPLQMIVKTGDRCDFLLTHPVVEALIMTKWNGFARLYFWLTFFLYMVFLSALNAYQLLHIRPYIAPNDSSEDYISTRIKDPDEPDDTCHEDEGCFTQKPPECVIFGFIVLVMSAARLMLEFVDLLDTVFSEGKLMTGLLSYLKNPENYLEIFLYSCSLAFSLNVFEEQSVISNMEWRIGTFAVLAGFINLLSFCQLLPYIGIYVVMFITIAQTFMTKIFLMFVFFIVAFFIVFHMMLGHTAVFRNFNFKSLFKVMTAGTTGVEYGDYDEPPLTDPISTVIALVFFLLFVQVLFLNLATGLAINDVDEIKKGATQASNALQIGHIYHAQRILFVANKVLKTMSQDKFHLIRDLRRFKNLSSLQFRRETLTEIREISKELVK